MPPITANLRSIVTPDGAIILDIGRNLIVPLNPMGGYIWNKLQDGLSVNEIVQEIVRETDAPLDTVESDIRTFIEQLTSMQLITVSPF